MARLKNLRAHEVSLVGAAANNREFLLLKSRDGNDNNIDNGEDEIISKEGDLMPEDKPVKDEPKKTDEPKPQDADVQKDKEPEKTIAVKDGKIDMSTVPEYLKPALETMEKDRDSDRAEVQKAREEVKEAREELKKERDASKEKEYVAKAKTLEFITQEADTFGPMWKRLVDAVSEEDAKAWEDMLISTNKQLEQSELLKIKGGNKPTAVSAWEEIQNEAKLLMEKSTTPITFEAATDEVLKQRKDLFEKYNQEQKERANGN